MQFVLLKSQSTVSNTTLWSKRLTPSIFWILYQK